MPATLLFDMLSQLEARYRESLYESILPFWMRHSLDHKNGGYFTCLDRDGSVFDPRKYVWMQGRQVWMLSRFYNEVERREEWLRAASLGAEFLRKHAFDEHGRCWFSLSSEGQPAFYQRKPYSAVFVALGFYEYAKASGEEWYAAKARELYAKVKDWIADSSPLGRPALPGAPAYSQLADIYVICSLALELGEVADLPDCLKRVRLHVEPVRRLLMENASADPQLRLYPEGRLVCVGSIFEIAWFLRRAIDLVPDPDLERTLLECVEGAIEFGWDQEHGGLFYFQDVAGKSGLALESNMKLWWVHAEALYCLLDCYARTGENRWLEYLERVAEWTFRHFPDPEFGEWFGYLDRRGEPALPLKGGSYKGFFHIPRALLFSLQAMEKLKQASAD